MAISQANPGYRFERLAGAELSKEAFPLIAPTVAFELMFPTDTLKASMDSLATSLANGSDVGMLITKQGVAMILGPGADWATIDSPVVDPEMPGFELDVMEI